MTLKRVLFALLICAQLDGASAEAERYQRIARAGKLWAYLHIFHPALGYREDIDWEAQWVKAYDGINAASSAQTWNDALLKMVEPLRGMQVDVRTEAEREKWLAAVPKGEPSSRLTADGVLVIRVPMPASYGAGQSALAAMRSELPKAKGVVLDVRSSGPAATFASMSALTGWFTSKTLTPPQRRKRVHQGFASPTMIGSGGYFSAWEQRAYSFVPAPAAEDRDIPLVILMNPDGAVTPQMVSLQAEGRAAILCEGGQIQVAVQVPEVEMFDMGSGVNAWVGYSELLNPDGSLPVANRTFPAEAAYKEDTPAFRAALEMARSGKWEKAERRLASVVSFSPAKKMHAKDFYPSKELRVLAGIQVWAVFHYFFPYKHLMGEDWEQVLMDYLPRLEAAADAEQYYFALAEMLTHTHDGHVGVTSNAVNLYGAPTPLLVRMIEGKPVVTGFRSKVEGVAAGDIIRKVDGKDAAERMAYLKKYITSSTPQGADRTAADVLLGGGDGSTAEVVVEDRTGNVRTVRLERYFSLYQQSGAKGETMKMLPGNIGYVNLVELTNEEVDTMFERFGKTKGIIMDMRGYPKGTAWSIAPRLAERPAMGAALFQRPIVTAPTGSTEDMQFLRVNDSHQFVQKIPNTTKPRYQGKTIMLIDERAISQSEHSGLFYEVANGTKFVGSGTAGANGDVTNFTVPGGLVVRFSGHDVRHADGRQLQRVGLVPHVEVRPTIAGVRDGKDEVLDRAIVYMNELTQ